MANRLESLLKLETAEPADSFILYGIALEYISLKDFRKAEEYLSRVLQHDSSYIPAYMQLALLKSDLNKIEEAKQLFINGIKKAKEAGDRRAVSEMEDFLNEIE